MSSFLRSSQSPKGNILSFLLTFLLRCLFYIQYLVHKISIWLNVLTHVYAHEPITTIKTMSTRVIPEISLLVISLFCPYLDSQLHILNSGSPLTDTPVFPFLNTTQKLPKTEIWKHFRDFLICFTFLRDHCPSLFDV